MKPCLFSDPDALAPGIDAGMVLSDAMVGCELAKNAILGSVACVWVSVRARMRDRIQCSRGHVESWTAQEGRAGRNEVWHGKENEDEKNDI
jgi:hypothetical protein